MLLIHLSSKLCCLVVKHLLSTCETLLSNSSTTKKGIHLFLFLLFNCEYQKVVVVVAVLRLGFSVSPLAILELAL